MKTAMYPAAYLVLFRCLFVAVEILFADTALGSSDSQLTQAQSDISVAGQPEITPSLYEDGPELQDVPLEELAEDGPPSGGGNRSGLKMQGRSEKDPPAGEASLYEDGPEVGIPPSPDTESEVDPDTVHQ